MLVIANQQLDDDDSVIVLPDALQRQRQQQQQQQQVCGSLLNLMVFSFLLHKEPTTANNLQSSRPKGVCLPV